MRFLVDFVFFLGESKDSAMKYYPAASFHMLTCIPLSPICAAYQKFAGLISDGVIGIFH
jgi:hypothetical protein